MQVLEAIFVFCCVWSLGACVVQRPGCEDRDRCLQVPLLLLLLRINTLNLPVLVSQPVLQHSIVHALRLFTRCSSSNSDMTCLAGSMTSCATHLAWAQWTMKRSWLAICPPNPCMSTVSIQTSNAGRYLLTSLLFPAMHHTSLTYTLFVFSGQFHMALRNSLQWS